MTVLKPLMGRDDIHAIERALLKLGEMHLRILEWGSGGSTIHFTRFLCEHDISYEWISLEYNKRWHKSVVDATKRDPHIKVVLFDVGNNHLYQRDTDMDKYVAYPSTLEKAFDLVLIDGRKRRRCILEARKMLTEDGVVFLHDAQRSYYHCAFGHFPDRCFVGPTMWRGKMTNPSAGKKLLNCIMSFYYRVVFVLFIAPVYKAKRIYSRYLVWKRERQKPKAD